MYRGLLNSLVFGLCLIMLTPEFAHGAVSVTTLEGDEIPIEVYGDNSRVRLLWLPPETGLKAEDREQAKLLAAQGVEVWLVDLFTARFLPLAQSSVDSMPAEDVARVIKAASTDGASVYLLAAGRGAVPLLRGVRAWQLQQGSVAGVILLHPKLYRETPNPGEAARLLPIVKLTNQAVYLLQPELSPWRWRLGEITAALEAGGSDVYTQVLPQVRDRFYFRPDAGRQETRMSAQLPAMVVKAMLRLQHLDKARSVVSGELMDSVPLAGKKERELRPYTGNPLPPRLELEQYQGMQRSLQAERGKVVLVNFWASWCPPCVHEMPSMQAIYTRLKPKGLEILAVNMAEQEEHIAGFLQNKVTVDFPLLLDRDGETLRRWDVFAFPTSFIVDRKGRIRYALFGAVDWQEPIISSKLEQLLAEK